MTNPHPPSDLMREQRLQRNLKIVVAVLGALIFLGLGAVAVRIIVLASGPRGSNSPSSQTLTAAPGATISFVIPAGAKIISTSLSGNRLAVHYDGPTGPGIAILDVETGRRIVDIKPVEGVPRN